MKRSHAWLVLGTAIWSIWIWVVFVMNQLRSPQPDESVGFRVVHFTIAGVSILLSLAIGRVALLHLRRPEAKRSTSL